MITRYLNPNDFQYQCIGIPNKTLISNASQSRFFHDKKCALCEILRVKNAHFFVEGRLRKQNLDKCAAGKIFWTES